MVDDHFDVALVIPLQGPAGIFGPSCEACAELAAEEVNRIFGNPSWDSSWELWFVEGETDFELEVQTASGKQHLFVELKKSHVSPAVAEQLLALRSSMRDRDQSRLLLLAPAVGRELVRFGFVAVAEGEFATLELTAAGMNVLRTLSRGRLGAFVIFVRTQFRP